MAPLHRTQQQLRRLCSPGPRSRPRRCSPPRPPPQRWQHQTPWPPRSRVATAPWRPRWSPRARPCRPATPSLTWTPCQRPACSSSGCARAARRAASTPVQCSEHALIYAFAGGLRPATRQHHGSRRVVCAPGAAQGRSGTHARARGDSRRRRAAAAGDHGDQAQERLAGKVLPVPNRLQRVLHCVRAPAGAHPAAQQGDGQPRAAQGAHRHGAAATRLQGGPAEGRAGGHSHPANGTRGGAHFIELGRSRGRMWSASAPQLRAVPCCSRCAGGVRAGDGHAVLPRQQPAGQLRRLGRRARAEHHRVGRATAGAWLWLVGRVRGRVCGAGRRRGHLAGSGRDRCEWARPAGRGSTAARQQQRLLVRAAIIAGRGDGGAWRRRAAGAAEGMQQSCRPCPAAGGSYSLHHHVRRTSCSSPRALAPTRRPPGACPGTPSWRTCWPWPRPTGSPSSTCRPPSVRAVAGGQAARGRKRARAARTLRSLRVQRGMGQALHDCWQRAGR